MPKRESILQKTNNLLLLYRHLVGESEVPMAYHDACAMAGIAACLADRVWVEKFKGAKLTPSLYTFLLGPTGLGKGEAIGPLQTFIDGLPRVNMFSGNITAEMLMQVIGGNKKNEAKHGKLFLITEELANSVPAGPAGWAFIKALTDFATRKVKFQKATLTGANANIEKPNVNWLAGTGIDWLLESVPSNMIEGGFIGRLTIVRGDYDFDKRVYWPADFAPHDYTRVRDHIAERFEQLTHVEGVFKITRRAHAVLRQWYETRPTPTREELNGTWKRAQDMALKYAQIFTMAESFKRVIREHHMLAARDMVLNAEATAEYVLDAARRTPISMETEKVRMLIYKAGTLHRHILVRAAARLGMTKRQVDQALETLYNAQDIESRKIMDGAGRLQSIVYTKRATGLRKKA